MWPDGGPREALEPARLGGAGDRGKLGGRSGPDGSRALGLVPRGLRSRMAPAGNSRGRPVLLRASKTEQSVIPRLLSSPLRIPRSSREIGKNPLFWV